jgi:Fe-S oxidoreductase
VFKDELTKMLPHDDDAARLARNAYHFGEFFATFGIQPPRLGGRALLWGHCHHRATGGIDPEQDMLQTMGLQVEPVSGGCCGLAGSWGFEKGKYQISLDCGEQALLPAVRGADRDMLIVANGFSCKTQIADARTRRRALHLGQVMQLAAAHPDGLPPGRAPESLALASRPKPPMRRRAARLLTAGAAIAGAVLAVRAAISAQAD